jgi:colanic acid/amylovoran biosynthesis glycosyltransferase
MKIAFVTGVFPKLSETFVINQITGLIDRGHDVHIFADKAGDDGKVHGAVAEYDLLARTNYWPDAAQKAKHGFGSLLRLGDGLGALKTLGYPEYGDFDVIYCHFGHVAERARELRDGGVFSGKLVAVFHAWDITVIFQNEPDDFYDDLFAEADLLLPISHLWKKKLERLGASPDKVKVHRMGIDVEQFAFRERTLEDGEPVRIVSVARLVEKKGIEYAIRALGAVKSGRPEAKFEYHIAGDGPLRKSLEKLARKWKVADHIHFHGWMDQAEVVGLLEDAHVLLVPSVTAENGDMEGLPVVLMEGMARGLPVVATRHSGIPEIVEDGVSGLLVDERDVDMLKIALDDMITEPHRWAEMGRAGRAIVERDFDIEALNDMLDAILRHV